jgi:4-hydroxy-tetrahydrodipicolinate synthase
MRCNEKEVFMNKKLAPGVWPTMVTLFNQDGTLDFSANAALTNRLIEQGAHGLFTVCQSSEMFFLTLQEKIDLAKCVVETAAGRVPVIASGHTSSKIEEQIDELGKISQTGVSAMVLVTNRLAAREQDKDTLLANMNTILNALPDLDFGIYECPYPFLRLLSLEELSLIAQSGKIIFLKDVSCNAAIQQERGELIKGSALDLYNAHAETLFNSFAHDYAGYSGIMGNFHIDIYRWYYENRTKEPEKAARVQQWIDWAGAVHGNAYPVTAKFYLDLAGIHCTTNTRMKSPALLTEDIKRAIMELKAEEEKLRLELGLKI